MLSQQLTDFYPFDHQTQPKHTPNLSQQTILIRDEQGIHGDFAFLSLLVKLIQDYKPSSSSSSADNHINSRVDKPQVLLVCCNHSYQHYETVLRKYGLDLRKLVADETVIIKSVEISPLSNYDNIAENTSSTSSLSSNDGGSALMSPAYQCTYVDGNDAPYISVETAGLRATATNSDMRSSSHQALSWDMLQQYIMRLVDERIVTGVESTSHRSISIMIDDLDCLEYIAPSAASAKQFIATLCRHQSSSVSRGVFDNIIAYCHGVGSSGNAEPASTMLYDLLPPLNSDIRYAEVAEYFSYRTDTTITLKPLSTGYSSEVHGCMTIQGRHPLARQVATQSSVSSIRADYCSSISRSGGSKFTSPMNLWQQTLVFKALESGVKCSVVSK